MDLTNCGAKIKCCEVILQHFKIKTQNYYINFVNILQSEGHRD